MRHSFSLFTDCLIKLGLFMANSSLKAALLPLVSILALSACDTGSTPPKTPEPTEATPEAIATGSGELVSFEQFELENGLKVIFHIDRSDPVVAVAQTFHVGSAREKTGRTGFAHLFEHLLFLESENLGKGGLDKLSARVGGSGANGSTSRDRTNYFQTVPKDALEKMIWAEADKLGYFINTVTDPVVAKEKQVVKNEKRQSVDNRAYGHAFAVIDSNLYPEGHPYSWSVIGSLEDIQAATLDDVKEFYRRWYVPNNDVLVVAGDFDPEQAKEWVEKYFGEIPRGEDVVPREKMPVALAESKNLYHEDNFARLPQLTMAWPTVPLYSEDSYALDVLADLLSNGKSAPFTKVLVEEEQLTSGVQMGSYHSELAGQMLLITRSFDGVDLDQVSAALDKAFAKFEEDGVSEADLARVKIDQEVSFYNDIQSVLGKAFNLAQYQIFAGDPGYINTDISKIQSVTADDVMRVYNTYIKDKPFVAASFVPKGQVDLAIEGSVKADIKEEKIIEGAEGEVDPNAVASYEKTPSEIDRATEPPYGETPIITPPTVWRAALDNGVKLVGIEDSELPLVEMQLRIDGGHMLDPIGKAGTAALMADLMTKGTANRTAEELENAIKSLGASIRISADEEAVMLSLSSLARTLDETLALAMEMLLEPRWDEAEFSLLKSAYASNAQASLASPEALATNVSRFIMYGKDSPWGYPVRGTASTIEAITLDDLKVYYLNHVIPNNASIKVVGDTNEGALLGILNTGLKGWLPGESQIPAEIAAIEPTESKVYFYDVPGAKQSIFAFGRPSVKATDDAFYDAQVMNYILGGGGFASRLTQTLREGKGYTYGIFSSYDGSARQGSFSIFSRIRSNVTLEAAQLVKSLMEDYADTFTDKDLEVTKGFQLKSQARAFESLGAKLNLLTNIADYGRSDDYVTKRGERVLALTIEDIQTLANAYLKPGAMNYVIVGDGETQAERLKELGFGDPIMMNDAFGEIQ